MDEYIKRESFMKRFCERCNEEMSESPCEPSDCFAREVIKTFPAADVAPVRHGRWIEPSRLYYGAKQYECSLCCSDTFWKKHSITEKYPHCPNCGAKMDGGDGNSDIA